VRLSLKDELDDVALGAEVASQLHFGVENGDTKQGRDKVS